MRVAPRTILRVAISAAALVGSLLGSGRIARADDTERRPGTTAGILIIAVATPVSDPASRAALKALRTHPWLVANRSRIQFVEMTAGTQEKGRSSGSPGLAISVYRRGTQGTELLATRTGFGRAEEAVQWILSLDSRTAALAPKRDTALTRTHWEHILPSQQAAPMPQVPASVPAMVQQPTVPQAVAPQSVPVMTFSVPTPTTTASVIQAPSQTYVIQQSPPQFYLAQQPGGGTFVPQSTGLATTTVAGNLFMPMSVAPASANVGQVAVASTGGSIAMPVSSLAPANVAQVAMAPATGAALVAVAPSGLSPAAVAPAAIATAPAATTAVANLATAAGPLVTGASLTTQSVSVPASSTRSRVRVRGPGPLAAALARFGERLTTLGRTRIETVQETNLQTESTQSPAGQVMTLSSTSASPVLTPQQNVTIPASLPQQSTAPASVPCLSGPPSPPPPSPSYPSPQDSDKHH